MEYFLLATNIATLITAIAALWTVREMERQRKLSVYPEFHCSNYVNFEYHNENQWGIRNSPLQLEFLNIGSKAAKNITFYWDFDIDNFIKVISEINNDKLVKIDKYPQFLSVEVGSSRMASSIHNNKTKFMNYFLPAETNSTPTKIDLPSTYTSLANALIYLQRHILDNVKFSSSNKDLKEIEITDIPSLNLKIEYYDIDNNKYENVFAIKTQIYGYGTKGQSSHGSLVTEKIIP